VLIESQSEKLDKLIEMSFRGQQADQPGTSPSAGAALSNAGAGS
jgi:hypothetical protein